MQSFFFSQKAVSLYVVARVSSLVGYDGMGIPFFGIATSFLFADELCGSKSMWSVLLVRVNERNGLVFT